MMVMGGLAAGGSLISGLSGMFGGGPQVNMPPPTPSYQPTGLPQADVNMQNLIGGQAGYGPQAAATEQALYNNPGAPGAVNAANVAGGMGTAGAGTQFGTGYGLLGAGMGAIPYANMAFQQAFDPMGQVYNQQFQQNTDQTRALLEQRGIDTTPYGAGVEAQSNLNFNNAWQQNLLNRMNVGAQAGSTMLGAGTGAIQQGIGDITGAAGNMFTGGFMPYQANQMIGQGQYGAITGAQGATQQPITNYLGYMGLGEQAAQVQNQQYQTALMAQQQQFNQQQAYMKQIGQGLGGMGNMFGGGGGTGLNFGSWGQNNPGVAGSGYYGPIAPG